MSPSPKMPASRRQTVNRPRLGLLKSRTSSSAKSFGMPVDFPLDGEEQEREGFIGVDQVADGIVDDKGAGSVDESLDRLDTASTFQKVPGALDIDGIEEG